MMFWLLWISVNPVAGDIITYDVDHQKETDMLKNILCNILNTAFSNEVLEHIGDLKIYKMILHKNRHVFGYVDTTEYPRMNIHISLQSVDIKRTMFHESMHIIHMILQNTDVASLMWLYRMYNIFNENATYGEPFNPDYFISRQASSQFGEDLADTFGYIYVPRRTTQPISILHKMITLCIVLEEKKIINGCIDKTHVFRAV